MYSTAEANETPHTTLSGIPVGCVYRTYRAKRAKHAGGYRRDNGNNWAVPHTSATCAPMIEKTTSPSASSTETLCAGKALQEQR